MTQIYVPVFKMAVPYSVTFGRRWSIIEHLLLIALVGQRRTVPDMAQASGVPARLVVEALINLLRAGWVEVRTTDVAALFTATPLGVRRAASKTLKAELQSRVRWVSVCMDRLTGCWLRATDLDLAHERDLSLEAQRLEPRVGSFDPQDGQLRELVTLARDEAFERFHSLARGPSTLFARVSVGFDSIDGLPPDAPLRLLEAVRVAAPTPLSSHEEGESTASAITFSPARDTIANDDIIVGGAEHLALVRHVLRTARSQVIVHSCFVRPEAIRILLDDLQAAAERKVRVDLLWGLHVDPEDASARLPIADAQLVLNTIPPEIRSRVVLSPISTGSHLKAMVYDTREGKWETLLGSCNYLSSGYNMIEVSLRSRSQRLAAQVMGQLIDLQIPASGAWSATTHRLNKIWSALKHGSRAPEYGTHGLRLLSDDDHYACVRAARDQAVADIVVGCDLFGLAAETSVLVPLERAAEMGRRVRLFYQRPSRMLEELGQKPQTETLQARGMEIQQVDNLHGKFLAWDDDHLAVSSFNWLSTVTDGTRAHGVELGVLVHGPRLREVLAARGLAQSGGELDVGFRAFTAEGAV